MSDQVVEAIHDLTRVMIALHGSFNSKSEAVRRLDELSIPPARIASILAMEAKDVRSALAKARKRSGKASAVGEAAGADGGINGEE